MAFPRPETLSLSIISNKSQLSAQAFHLIDELKHSAEPGQIALVNGSQVLHPPYGINRLFRELHHPVRWLKDGSHKTGPAIDQKRTAGDAREMNGGIETLKNVWHWLKQLKSK